MALLFVKAQVKLKEGLEKAPLRADEVGTVKGFEGKEVRVDFPTNPGVLVDPGDIELADEDLLWKILFQCFFVKAGRATDEVAKDLGVEDVFVKQVKQLALHMAAHKGLEGAVELLLKAKCPKDTHLEYLGTPLLCAIKNGHTATAGILIEKGADVQASDEHGDTIIYFPVRSGDIKALEFCFNGETKINVNHTNKEDQTPLHAACIAGQPASVEFLIQHGANINALDRKSCTPLHYAVIHGHKECVYLLLNARCKPDIFDKEGYTPLMHAVIQKRAEMVTVLTVPKDGNQNQSVASINRSNQKNITPLMLACQYSDLACVRELIARGASLEDSDMENHTPMHYAVKGKQCATLEFILGITEAREELERRAIEEAKRQQERLEEEKRRAEEEKKRQDEEKKKADEEKKKADEEKKATPAGPAPDGQSGQAGQEGQGGQGGQGGQDQPQAGPAQTSSAPAPSQTGPTPAQTGPTPAQTGPTPAQGTPAQPGQKVETPQPGAEEKGDEKKKKKKEKVVVQWQCRSCAENSEIVLHAHTTAVCSKCGFGWRALLTQIYLFAAEEGVRAVLEHFHGLLGKIANMADEDGVTPLMKACFKNRQELVEFIIATLESDYESRDAHGQTAIFYATKGNALESVKQLRSAGASWDVQDRRGMTPFAYAAKIGNVPLVEYFVEKANAELPDHDGLTVLAHGCQCEDGALGPKVVQTLLSHRIIKVDPPGHDGDTPLLRSARQRRWEVVKILIEGGANVSFRGRDNMTLLILACWEKQHGIVSQILDLEDIKKDVLGYLIEEGKYTISGVNTGVAATAGWASDSDFVSDQIKNIVIKENTEIVLEKFFHESKKILPRRSIFALENRQTQTLQQNLTVKLEKSGTARNLDRMGTTRNLSPSGSGRATGVWDESGMDKKYGEGKIEVVDEETLEPSGIPSPSGKSKSIIKSPRDDGGVEMSPYRETKVDEDLKIDPALLGTLPAMNGGSIIGVRERQKRRESHFEKLDKSMDCWMFILLSIFAKKEDMRQYLINNFALITLTRVHRTQAHNVLVHSIQETNVDVVDFLTQTIHSTFQKPILMCLRYARDFRQRGEKTPSKQEEYDATADAFTEMAVTLLNKIDSDYVAMWVLEQGILEAALNWNIIGFVSTPRVYRIASYWWDKAWVNQDVDSTRQGVLDADKKSLPADYGDVHFGLFSLLRQSPYRFYRLPRIKFLTEGVAYGFYLALFSWMMGLGLAVNEPQMHSVEIAFFVFGLGILLGEISQVSGQEGTWKEKLGSYVDSGWNVLDIVILFLLGIIFVLRAIYSFGGTSDPPPDPNHSVDTFYTLVMSLEILTMTIRFLFIFSVDPKFGPLVVSLRGMVKDVVLFFILYSVFYYGFYFTFFFVTDLDIADYNTPRSLFLTILYSALGGGPDRSNYDSVSDARRNVLEFITILYVIVQSLVMVNLLIAMMANSYQSVQEKAVAISIYGFVQTVYSADTSPSRLPAPFNLIEAVLHSIINVLSTGCLGCLKLAQSQETTTSTCIQISCRWCRKQFCYCDVRKSTCLHANKPPIKQEGLVACPNCHRSVDVKEIESQKKNNVTRKTTHRGTASLKELSSFCVFCVVLPFILVILLFDLVKTIFATQNADDDGSNDELESEDIGAALQSHVQAQKQAKAARLMDETLDDIHEKVKHLKKD